MSLDQIMFDLPEPDRTHALEKFLDANHDEPVKLRSSQGTLKVRFRGAVITVPPSGKWVGRRTAVDLIYAFGKNGVYQGKDMATGLTHAMLDNMPKEERQYWLEDRGIEILDKYLYHDVKDELTELAAEE
jgi:hypothetical protein